jgi:TM2 domain-containing membrane protein YozV
MSNMVFCRGCGKEIHETAVSCPQCGALQGKQNVVTKRRAVAGVLALLLGGLGIHKFYTGAWGWGILYILFCWTYIPAVFALIEGIRYLLVLSDAQFNSQIAKQSGPFSVIW